MWRGRASQNNNLSLHGPTRSTALLPVLQPLLLYLVNKKQHTRHPAYIRFLKHLPTAPPYSILL